MATTSSAVSRSVPLRWRSSLEPILLPFGALLASLLIFGLFCAMAGANPFAVYGSIYRAAFGSWFSWQNTLQRAAPLMLTSLCTILPARMGLVIIGNEGALVMGGGGSCGDGAVGGIPGSTRGRFPDGLGGHGGRWPVDHGGGGTAPLPGCE